MRPTAKRPSAGTSAARVVAIDPQRDARWEAFVAAHPDGLIYHHPAWLAVLERAYGHTALALACEDSGGRLRGVLPLFRTRGLLTGRRLASLPHTPVAGPLAEDDHATAALVGAAVERARAEGAQLQLKVAAPGLDRVASELRGRPWEETYVLMLPERPDELRFGSSRNHARIKWAASKAERLGVRVRPAETEEELRRWYRLYLDAMRWHAVPPRPFGFFTAVWALLRPRGLARLLLAEQHDGVRPTLLAGSFFLMFGRTVFYAFNGRRRERLSVRPNDLIQLRSIQDACAEGFRVYDLGEVGAHQHGLAEFKSKWGADARRLYRFYYPAPRELESDVLEPDSRLVQVASAAWRRLPLPATAVLGSWLYRYL